MLIRITGEIKDYPWGSTTLVQDHLGIADQGQQVAEVWFGTHHGGASKVIGSTQSLEDISGPLPFLVKFLAAASPLSIQVHPNKEQAKSGFEREQQLGIPLSDPARNYKDQSDKPEMLIALTNFQALCGFRPSSETREILSELGSLDSDFENLLPQLDQGLEKLFVALLNSKALTEKLASLGQVSNLSAKSARALALAQSLLNKYPADTGALVSLMLNHLELAPGEAVFLPAGNLHAYLSGLGLEVMASSDNVIRGGLTNKHIDTQELLRITEFRESLEPLVKPKKLAHGLIEYPVEVPDFRVYKAEVSGTNLFADLDLPSKALVIGIAGEVAVSTSNEERELVRKSEVLYLADSKKFSLSGSGEVFVVTC